MVAVLWIVNAAAFAVCFRAFELPVPPEAALVLQGVVGFGCVAVLPGLRGRVRGRGARHAGVVRVDATRAVSYAVAYHVGTFIPITVLGLASLSRMRLHLAELRSAPAED